MPGPTERPDEKGIPKLRSAVRFALRGRKGKMTSRPYTDTVGRLALHGRNSKMTTGPFAGISDLSLALHGHSD